MMKALGLIEVAGLATTVVALDTALKAANVTLLGVEPAKGGGYHTLKLEGDVGAVNAAVEAATGHPEVRDKVVSVKVIPRPAQGIGDMVHSKENRRTWPKTASEAPAPQVEGKPLIAEPKDAGGEEEIERAPEGGRSKEEAPNEETPAPPPSTKKAEPDPKRETEPAKTPARRGPGKVAKAPAPLKGEGRKKPEEGLKSTALRGPLEEETSREALEEDMSKGALGGEPPQAPPAEDEASCNLCGDPQCPRHKGEPHSGCIHYKKKENRK